MHNLYYTLAAAAIISAGFNIHSSNAGSMSSNSMPQEVTIEKTIHHESNSKHMKNNQDAPMNDIKRNSNYQTNHSSTNPSNDQNLQGEVVIEEETYTTED